MPCIDTLTGRLEFVAVVVVFRPPRLFATTLIIRNLAAGATSQHAGDLTPIGPTCNP